MKLLSLSLILALNALTSHAAPSPAQHAARQATTLSLDCTGATGSYQVEIVLPSQENFYPFNISESIPIPIPIPIPLTCSPLSYYPICPMPTYTYPTINPLSSPLSPTTPNNIYPSLPANPLSVSTCALGGPGFCGLTGADGSDFEVNGGYSVDIGPPQPLTGGVCSTF